jgi:hypothetical protein
VFDVTDRLMPAADNVIAVSVDHSYQASSGEGVLQRRIGRAVPQRVSQGRRESGRRLFEWSSVALRAGVNEIRASATKGGIVYQDACQWNYTP